MAGQRYLGPADNFIVNGKTYHPGDEIPLSRESAAHHVANGHRFEGWGDETPTAPAEGTAHPAGAPAAPAPPK